VLYGVCCGFIYQYAFNTGNACMLRQFFNDYLFCLLYADDIAISEAIREVEKELKVSNKLENNFVEQLALGIFLAAIFGMVYYAFFQKH
jgi:hypothetical protein